MKNGVRIMCSLLAVIMCFLAGCGEDADGGKKNSGNINHSGDPEITYFENVPPELDGSTVEFATWIDHNSNESAQVLSDFTDITGIDVEITFVPPVDYVSKIAALIAGGMSPDVIVNNSEWPKILSLLQPLDGTKLDATDEFWNQDVVKSYTVGGRPYAVNVKGGAWDMGGAVIVYNKRMFEDNGITTPDLYIQEGRWTLDNFFKAAKQLSAVFPAGGAGVSTSIYLGTYGKSFVNYDSAEGKFSSNIQDPVFVNTYKQLLEARDAGYIVENAEGYRHLFERGELPMILVGSYGLRKYGWFSSMDAEEIGYTLLPKKDANSEQPYGVDTGRSYGIARGAENPDGAAYFLRYFLNADNYDEEELYKNEECKELLQAIYEHKDNTVLNCDISVMSILTGLDGIVSRTFPELEKSTAAQISTALNSGAKTLNACIDKANEMIQTAIEENK